MSGRNQQQQFQDQQHMQYMQQSQQQQQHGSHQQQMDHAGTNNQQNQFSSFNHNIGNQGMPVAICPKHDQVVNAYCKAHAQLLCNPCTQEHLSVQLHQNNDIVNINMAVNDNMQMMEAHLKDFQAFYEFKSQVRVDLFNDQNLAQYFIQNSQAFDELLNSIAIIFKQFLNMSAGQQAMNLSQTTMQFMSECQKMAGVRGVIENLNSMNQQHQQQPQQQQNLQNQQTQNQSNNINSIQQQNNQQQNQQLPQQFNHQNGTNGQQQQVDMSTKLPSLASVNQEIQQNYSGSVNNGGQNNHNGNINHQVNQHQKAPQSPPQQQMNNSYQNAPNNQQQHSNNLQDMNMFFDQNGRQQSNNNQQQQQTQSNNNANGQHNQNNNNQAYPLPNQNSQQQQNNNNTNQQNTPTLPPAPSQQNQHPQQHQQQQQQHVPCQLPSLNQRLDRPSSPLQDTDFFKKQGQQQYQSTNNGPPQYNNGNIDYSNISNPESHKGENNMLTNNNSISQQQQQIPQLDSFAVATQNIQQHAENGNNNIQQQDKQSNKQFQQHSDSYQKRGKHQQIILFIVLRNLICNRSAQNPIPQYVGEGVQYRWQIQVSVNTKVQVLKRQVRELVFKNFAFESIEQSQECGKQLDRMKILHNNCELSKQTKDLNEYGIQENDELVFVEEQTTRGDSRLNDVKVASSNDRRERDPSPTNFLSSNQVTKDRFEQQQFLPSISGDQSKQQQSQQLTQAMKLPKINDATNHQLTQQQQRATIAAKQNPAAKDPPMKKARSSTSNKPKTPKEAKPKKEIQMKTIFFRIRDPNQKSSTPKQDDEEKSHKDDKNEQSHASKQEEDQDKPDENGNENQEEKHEPAEKENNDQSKDKNQEQPQTKDDEQVFPYQVQFNVTRQVRLKQFKKQLLIELGMQDQCYVRLFKDDKPISDIDTELIQDLDIIDKSKIEVELFMRLTVSVMNKGSGYVNKIEVSPDETMDVLRQKVPSFRMFTSRGYSIVCEKTEKEFSSDELNTTLFKDSGLANGATIVLKNLKQSNSTRKQDVPKPDEDQIMGFANAEEEENKDDGRQDEEMLDGEEADENVNNQINEGAEGGEDEMEEMEEGELEEGFEDDMYGDEEDMQQLYGKMMQKAGKNPQFKHLEEEFSKQIQEWQKMKEAMEQKNSERAEMKKQLEKHDDLFAFNDEDVQHVQDGEHQQQSANERQEQSSTAVANQIQEQNIQNEHKQNQQ